VTPWPEPSRRPPPPATSASPPPPGSTWPRALRGAGDQATARTLLEANDRWYRASGGGDGALLTRCLLAALAAEQDDQAAIADLQTVLEEARRHHDLETQTLALDSLARAAAAGGDLPGAARLLKEADGLHAQVRHTLDDADRVDAGTARASLAAARPGGLEGAGEPVDQDADRLG
jgi:hypothetical protein